MSTDDFELAVQDRLDKLKQEAWDAKVEKEAQRRHAAEGAPAKKRLVERPPLHGFPRD